MYRLSSVELPRIIKSTREERGTDVYSNRGKLNPLQNKTIKHTLPLIPNRQESSDKSPIKIDPFFVEIELNDSVNNLNTPNIDIRYHISEKIFSEVESVFCYRVKYEHTSIIDNEEPNVCCNSMERAFLLSISTDLKHLFANIQDKDICIAVIYTYYALNLNETSGYDFNPDIYANYAEDEKEVNRLYWLLSIGDIISDGDNISKRFRRECFFALDHM